MLMERIEKTGSITFGANDSNETGYPKYIFSLIFFLAILSLYVYVYE